MAVSREQILQDIKDPINRGAGKPIFMIYLTDEIEPYVTKDGKIMDWSGCQLNFMGFYYDLDDAIDAMHYNAMDISEDIFTCGYITVGFQGVYNHAADWYNRMFFKWNNDKEGFFEEENEPKLMRSEII